MITKLGEEIVKSAAAWHKRIANLRPEDIKNILDMNPQYSLERIIIGINKGTRNMMERHGIHEVAGGYNNLKPKDLWGARNKVQNVIYNAGLRGDNVTKDYNIMVRNRLRSINKDEIGEEIKFPRYINEAGSMIPDKLMITKNLEPLKFNNENTLSNELYRALVRRHEANEIIVGEKYMKKLLTNPKKNLNKIKNYIDSEMEAMQQFYTDNNVKQYIEEPYYRHLQQIKNNLDIVRKYNLPLSQDTRSWYAYGKHLSPVRGHLQTITKNGKLKFFGNHYSGDVIKLDRYLMDRIPYRENPGLMETYKVRGQENAVLNIRGKYNPKMYSVNFNHNNWNNVIKNKNMQQHIKNRYGELEYTL